MGDQLTARYLSGLKLAIHDDLVMHPVGSLLEAYQMAFTEEEKLRRKSSRRVEKTSHVKTSTNNQGSTWSTKRPNPSDGGRLQGKCLQPLVSKTMGETNCFLCRKTECQTYECPYTTKENRLNLTDENEIKENKGDKQCS